MLFDTANTIFWGVLTFSILILLHEGGHFVAARAFGVKVHEFMMGLPGPAIRLKTKSTTYGITMIPLGGYVRIAGMEPGPEDEFLGQALKEISMRGRMDALGMSQALGVDAERATAILMTLADWGAVVPSELDDVSYEATESVTDDADPAALLDAARKITYRGLSTTRRILVLVAGVAVNLLAAILIFTVILSIYGYDVPSPEISGIAEDSPAAAAGLREGDTVVAVNGREIEDWYELLNTLAVTRPGETGQIRYLRDGTERTASITYGESPHNGGAYLGITSGELKHVNLNVWESFVTALKYTRDTFVMIAAFFNPETFSLVAKNARSVVGVSVEAANIVEYGRALGYAQFIALLSLSLGIMNILPIPPLDGGKVLVEIIERVSRRQLARNVQLGLSLAGAVLLFSLIGYLMYADVLRYFVNV